MIEVTRSKNGLFPILADLCSYGVGGLKSESEVTKVKIWGHQGKTMTFSKFWLIRALMGSRGLKSESEVTKVKTWGHKVQK